jgi:hypothetical protein
MSAREQMEKARKEIANGPETHLSHAKSSSGERRETSLSKAAKRNGGTLPVSKEKPIKKNVGASASSFCKDLLRQKKWTDDEITEKVKAQFKDFSGNSRVVVIRSCINRDEKLSIAQLTKNGTKTVPKGKKETSAPATPAAVKKLTRGK